MAKIFSILIVLLFSLSYPLTCLIAGDNIELWWKVKQIIYNVVIGLAVSLASQKSKGWTKYFLDIALGLVVYDIVDRVFFDITTFGRYDILMILLTVAFATHKNIHLYVRKRIG